VASGEELAPVVAVTWHGAAAFCNWLSARAGLGSAYDQETWDCNGQDPYGANGFRLPTEAEWEYVCRGGSASAFANGEITEIGCGDPVLAAIGWHCGSGSTSALPVGELVANDWDLFDMHGNVFEWCNDRYGLYAGDATNPTGATTGINRVMRGGSWSSQARFCRSAARSDFAPFHSGPSIGFRPVRSETP
jgi:formylglycine-generating enzyme required for sulfatase activity